MKTEFMIEGIILIVTLLGKALIFKKMDEPGWKAFIPVYSEYVLYKKVWNKRMFKAYLLALIGFFMSFGFMLFAGFMGAHSSIVFHGAVLTVILCAVFLGIECMSYYKLSKHFGHGMGYTFGLIFLEPVFNLILGCSNDQYVKAIAS